MSSHTEIATDFGVIKIRHDKAIPEGMVVTTQEQSDGTTLVGYYTRNIGGEFIKVGEYSHDDFLRMWEKGIKHE